MIDTVSTQAALQQEMTLLQMVSQDPQRRFIWLWQGDRSLVVPRKLAVHPNFEDTAANLASTGWPVHMRASGGDATPQGPGIVNITHVYAVPRGEGFDLDREYDRLCRPIEARLGKGATRGWQPGAFCDGAHNVQFQGRKFAGTAMRFRPSKADQGQMAVMAHALMLFQPPTPAAIDALNALLAGLDQGRAIDADAHTGLPQTTTPKDFAARLLAAFHAMPDLPPARTVQAPDL